MIYIFYIVTLIGLYFFVLRRRVFDFPCLAFAGALIYFLPGYFGYVNYNTGSGRVVHDIHWIVYVVYTATLLFIIAAGILSEKIVPERPSGQGVREGRTEYYILVSAALLITVLWIYSDLNELLSPGKPETGRLHKLFHIFVGVSVISSVYIRKYKMAVFLFLFLIFDVYTGNREGFAMTVFGVIFVTLRDMDYIRVIKRYKTILFSLLSLMALFIYKKIYGQAVAGEWLLIYERLSDGEYLTAIFDRTEPFVIQANFNRIVVENLHYDGAYFSKIFDEFLPFGRKVLYSSDFSGWLNNQIYAYRDAGVASNIFAEGYAIGWVPMALLFTFILFFILPVIYELLLRKANYLGYPHIVLSASYILVYTHRSGLHYQLSIQRRILLSFVFFSMLYLVVARACGRR